MASHCSSTARSGQQGDAGSRRLTFRCLGAACAVALAGTSAQAANEARISSLSDVSFGTITNFAADLVRSQSICVHAKSPPGNNYRVTAAGSGTGGAFLLNSGSSTLPYEVQWSATPAQTIGTQLLPNQALAAQHTTSGPGDADDCSKGPATTASLILIVRSAAVGTATSGTYNGTLTLVIAPE